MEEYAPCPNCQQSNATQISFTWWGGMIGPRILSHVKCQSCGTTYNGKSGKSNIVGIIIYTIVIFVVLLFVFAAIKR